MPTAPPRQCATPQCGGLAYGGPRCEKCRRAYIRALDRERAPAHERGYDWKWRKYSKQRLKLHPWCVDPYQRHGGRKVLATCTDHVIPHKGDMALFWDPENHQSLCHRCNSMKAALEEGRFGPRTLPKSAPETP